MVEQLQVEQLKVKQLQVEQLQVVLTVRKAAPRNMGDLFLLCCWKIVLTATGRSHTHTHTQEARGGRSGSQSGVFRTRCSDTHAHRVE